ncbi:MAG: tRNA glutamyl-Q(34) synthetase GluQRS [Mariprofundaceae bacterium]
MLRTRFAPSPTGHLHIGNAYSALVCQQWAEQHHARLLLRIEDIDHTRCRQGFIDDMLEDLRWLGLRWQGEPIRQSQRLATYRRALDSLQSMGVLYPCFCTRKQIQAEIARMGIAPHQEDSADPYPGTCRNQAGKRAEQRAKNDAFAWRLNIARAFELLGKDISWRDGKGHHYPVRPQAHGDVVLGRKDIGISYHLAVTIDDADQGVTHVIRGIDLEASTGVHRLLQALLELPSPAYIHHGLLVDEQGERMAKRHHAPTLRSLRQQGVDPAALRESLLYHADEVGKKPWQLGCNTP